MTYNERIAKEVMGLSWLQYLISPPDYFRNPRDGWRLFEVVRRKLWDNGDVWGSFVFEMQQAIGRRLGVDQIWLVTADDFLMFWTPVDVAPAVIRILERGLV